MKLSTDHILATAERLHYDLAFQQDEALPHFYLPAREYLNNEYLSAGLDIFSFEQHTSLS